MEDGYTLHDYNIRQNDVIQLMPRSIEDAMQDDEKNTTDKKENGHTNGSNKLDKYDGVYFYRMQFVICCLIHLY